MDKEVKTNESNESKTYANVVQTEGNINTIISINEVELNNIQLNCEDPYNAERKFFHVKKTFKPRLSIDTPDFKMKHCRKVRSILCDNKKYNGIYHPKDDTHAFYILRNKQGIFDQRENESKQIIHNRKRLMLKIEIDKFIIKFNSVVDINNISQQMRSFLHMKILLYVLMGISICCLSYCFLFSLMISLSLLMGSHKGNFINGDHDTEHSDWSNAIYFTALGISIVIVYILYRLLCSYQAKEKILLFNYLLSRRRDLEIELEYMNTSVFNPYSMKCVLAETLDYVGVFYDREIEYEIDEHFN